MALVRALALLLLLGGCRTFTAPPADHLNPPVAYLAWWDATQTCAGLTGEFGRITWYVTAERFASPDGLVAGWWASAHTITLAGLATDDEQTVRHEMLHDLLQSGDHPAVFDTCGLRF